jgi:hypothetical protein|tara:strand:- start:241 stop:468 length:228 start_codon:yes stop_codon:yes gene_type:complete
MKLIFTFLVLILLSNCSLNKDSIYWSKDVIKKKNDQKKLLTILKKSENITNMTIEEYKIYIDDFTKKSKYPDINQ